MTMPCAWDVVTPPEMCADWDDYPQATKDSALWLASTWLWGATGRQFGACPITVRPSQARGGEVLYRSFEVIPGAQSGLGTLGGPFLFGGRWFNSSCASACCGSGCAIVLRGPVSSVEEVLVGEEVVPPSAYRVDVTQGTYLLVRRDGECWPTCQNFTADEGEEGSFSVTYDIGRALPEALAIATAMLACEWAKGIAGGPCKLPARMTRLSRQGVEVEVAPQDPAEGFTGIKEVDDIVSTLNPSKRKSPPLLLSPDMPENCDRMTVWVGGS
jgi:hypothetical protein